MKFYVVHDFVFNKRAKVSPSITIGIVLSNSNDSAGDMLFKSSAANPLISILSSKINVLIVTSSLCVINSPLVPVDTDSVHGLLSEENARVPPM